MSISIIETKESDRKRIASAVIRDAIVNARELPAARRGFDCMTSGARSLLVKYPENRKDRCELVARINEFIRLPDVKMMDFNILSYVAHRLTNNLDATDFFQNRMSRSTENVLLYARTNFKFKDNNEKDEELY